MTTLNNKIYKLLGSKYIFIPEELRSLILNIYERNANNKELLPQVESAIKDTFNNFKKAHTLYTKANNEHECLILLLEARRVLMNRMFTLSKESFNQFKTINSTLYDLSEKTRRKLFRLYDTWFNNEEDEWKNDCEIKGRIIPEGWIENSTDETNSDYDKMIEIIEEIGNRDLLLISFSGHSNLSPSYISATWDFSSTESHILFSHGGPKPFGDFTMCRAFARLYKDSLYCNQDILRIQMFWADASITHQRIVTPNGILL